MPEPDPPALLLVDDEAHVREALARLLRGEGYRVETASHADAAVEQLHAAEFDAVISDFDMPGRSGRDLMMEVARRWPRTARIILSAGIDGAVADELLATGVVHAIEVKPAPALGDVVRRALAAVAAGEAQGWSTGRGR